MHMCAEPVRRLPYQPAADPNTSRTPFPWVSQAQALNYFQTWPEGVPPDPLALCIANVNAAGDALSPEQREAVMQELPKAMPKLSLLLAPLAHTN